MLSCYIHYENNFSSFLNKIDIFPAKQTHTNKEMDRTKLILSTNIGLGGKSNEATTHHSQIAKNVKSRYRKLHDRMTNLYNRFGIKTDILCVQELGYTNFVPRPFVNGGLKNYSKKSMSNEDISARGVGIFTERDEVESISCLNDKDEITCIIDAYKNNQHQKVRFAVINCYRRINVNSTRSIEQTEKIIKRYTDNLRNVLNIRNILIVGDFNYEGDINLGINFKEIRDHRFYHKHNISTAKKYIDRVWKITTLKF